MIETGVEFINKEAAEAALVGLREENDALRAELERVVAIAQNNQKALALAHTKLAAIKLLLGGELAS